MNNKTKKSYYEAAHKALADVISHSDRVLAKAVQDIAKKVEAQAEHVWIADHVDMEPMDYITKTWDSMEVALHNNDIGHFETLLGELRMHTDDFEKNCLG